MALRAPAKKGKSVKMFAITSLKCEERAGLQDAMPMIPNRTT
jgi:hypothetical protein